MGGNRKEIIMPADFPDKLYICTDTLTFYLVNNWDGLVFIGAMLIPISIIAIFINLIEDWKYSKRIAALILISVITIFTVVPPRELLINKVINKIMIINNVPDKYFSVIRGLLEEQAILSTREEVISRVAKFRIKDTSALIPLIEVEEGVMYEKLKSPTN